DLLMRLVSDGAVFVTDSEVRQLLERSWSLREIGGRGVLVRYYGVPREPIRFPARMGTTRVSVREGRGPEDVTVTLEGAEGMARLSVGAYRLEWKRVARPAPRRAPARGGAVTGVARGSAREPESPGAREHSAEHALVVLEIQLDHLLEDHPGAGADSRARARATAGRGLRRPAVRVAVRGAGVPLSGSRSARLAVSGIASARRSCALGGVAV